MLWSTSARCDKNLFDKIDDYLFSQYVFFAKLLLVRLGKKRGKSSSEYVFCLQLRDLTHENLNRLVGIVIEDEFVEILTEYCAKGSLADVLENDSLKLDWPFRFSLISDIIDVKSLSHPNIIKFGSTPALPHVCLQAMVHLHESPVQSHGSLTSSNCVIDSRFVLKVTDYGLGFLQPYFAAKDHGETDYFRLLWRAPELLRAPMPTQGTQNGKSFTFCLIQLISVRCSASTGDIYSFGIILQEIILRCEPYGSTDAKRLPMEPYCN